LLLEQPNQPNQPLNSAGTVNAFQFNGPPTKDDLAIALVVQNTKRAEAFLETRLWMSEWRVAKGLYEAPVRQQYWRDTLVPRASNSFPLCAQHVRAVLDQTMPAVFPEKVPFAIDPNQGTSWQVARAWEAVLAYQLQQTNFKQEMRLLIKDAEVFGIGIGKWGWESFTKKREIYKRTTHPEKLQNQNGQWVYQHTKESDQLDVHEVEEVVTRPFFKRCEINHVLVDPSLRVPDIRYAKYVVYRDFLTLRDLNQLRDCEGWNIPSEDELRQLAVPPEETAPGTPMENEATAYPAQGHRPLPRYIDSSEDPLDHKLEVLEYWTNDSVICVLQRKKLIRNEKNPFGCLPFVSAFWDDIPGSFYAFGIPRRIGGIQVHIQGLRNLRLDDINLNLQQIWLCKIGTEIAAQPMKAYPGAVFKVDDTEKDLRPLIKQPVLAEAYHEEEVLINDAERTSGANALVTQGGSLPGNKSTGMRSSAGAQAVAGASDAHIQGFANTIIEQAFVPTLNAFIEMSRQRMDLELTRRIIGNELWTALESSYINNGSEESQYLSDAMCNVTDLQVSVLASSNLNARTKMAQSLPVLGEMFMQPAFQKGLADAGKKVNWLEYGRRMERTSGWDDTTEIFIPLTPEDKQAAAAANPEVLKAQSTKQRLDQMAEHKSDLSAQEHQQKMEQEQNKGLVNAGQEVLVKSIERAQVKEEEPQISGDLGTEG
jgi:hypothetical protein